MRTINLLLCGVFLLCGNILHAQIDTTFTEDLREVFSQLDLNETNSGIFIVSVRPTPFYKISV
jgi:hypothetical protein